LTYPRRLGCPYSASSENPPLVLRGVQHLSWGFAPYGILVFGANIARGFRSAVRSPSQGFSPSQGQTSPKTFVVLFHTTTPLGFPVQRLPLLGSMIRYRIQSLHVVQSILASSLRRKKPKWSATPRVYSPRRTFASFSEENNAK